MAQTAHVYSNAMLAAFNKEIDWVSDTVKAILLDDTYVPDQGAHAYVDDLTGELVGGSYARATVGTKTAVINVDGELVLSCAAISFAALTGDYRYMVLAVDTGVAATSPLVGYLDFGALETATAQPVVVTPAAEGLFVHQVL